MYMYVHICMYITMQRAKSIEELLSVKFIKTFPLKC